MPLSTLARRRVRDAASGARHILLETQVAALVNIASSYLISGEMPRRGGTAHGSRVSYQGFETKDKYLIIAAGNNNKLCHVLAATETFVAPRFQSE